MLKTRRPQTGAIYQIIEGEAKGNRAKCTGFKESSFGRVWVDLEMIDGTKITKRLEDTRTAEELREENNGTRYS